MSKVIGIKIKNAVKVAGFSSHREFAKKVGIGETMISKWTSGDRNPSVTTLKKIAKATGKPLSYFFDNLGDISNNNDNKGIIGHLNSGNVLNSEKEEATNKKLEDIQNNINDKFKVLELKLNSQDLKLDLILEKLKKEI
jgi:transcriptional regulator with XRE-family HTH domain